LNLTYFNWYIWWFNSLAKISCVLSYFKFKEGASCFKFKTGGYVSKLCPKMNSWKISIKLNNTRWKIDLLRFFLVNLLFWLKIFTLFYNLNKRIERISTHHFPLVKYLSFFKSIISPFNSKETSVKYYLMIVMNY
jgi:hypothetical protein